MKRFSIFLSKAKRTLLLCIGMMPIFVFSQITWNGSTSTAWNTAANWTPATVPTAADDVVIPWAVPNNPSITTNADCRDLTILDNAMVNIDARGTLNANRNIDVQGPNGMLNIGFFSSVLNVLGDLNIDGMIIPNRGQTNFVGTSLAQTASGTNVQTISGTGDIFFFGVPHTTNISQDINITNPNIGFDNLTFITNSTITTNANSIFVMEFLDINTGTINTNGGGNLVFVAGFPTSVAGPLNTANVTVAAGANVTFNANSNITNNLTLNGGIVNINGGVTLTIGTNGADGTITDGTALGFDTNYIRAFKNGAAIGTLRMMVNNTGTTYNFPIGDATNYSPATITLNAGTTLAAGAYIDMYVKDAKPVWIASGDHITRNWEITPSGITTPNYDINYQYVDADVSGTEASIEPIKKSAGVVHIGDNSSLTVGTKITGSNSSINIGNNTLTWTAVTSFGDYSGGGGAIVLPIELVKFDAKNINNKDVKIIWQTASEEDNDYFLLEKSYDGVNFKELKIIDGAGNSNTLLDYEVTDKNAFATANVVYYRIKQVDEANKGEKQYHIISAVSNSKSANTNNDYKIYPNPATDYIFVELNKNSKIEISNTLGNVLYKGEAKKGTSKIDISNLQTGMYFVKMLDLDKITKIVIK